MNLGSENTKIEPTKQEKEAYNLSPLSAGNVQSWAFDTELSFCLRPSVNAEDP